MAFDPRLALTFVAVADTLSFTRAAERLGVAQPWVSEQLRRLEDQLGFRVLGRTSRRVELTEQGAHFLLFARALSDANDAAQKFARETVSEANQTLHIGATDLVAGFQARTALIDRFVVGNPNIQLQIDPATVPELLAKLKRGDLDFVLAYTTSGGLADDLEATVIGRRFAHLMVPAEDPMAAMTSIPISALAGRTMVSSPGRVDPNALRQVFSVFTNAGAQVQPAPEANRTTIEHYARIRRLICLKWSEERLERHEMGDMICIPIAGEAPVLKFAVLRNRGPGRRAAQRFWEAGQALAKEALAAGAV